MDGRKASVLRVVLVFYLICPANIIGLWWAVGSPLTMDRNTICRRSRRIGKPQRRICKQEPETVEQVVKGANMSIHECQYLFKDRKWNCSTQKRSLNRILKFDTRESGFVHAMTSAGVLYSITRACAVGEIEWCPCENKINRDWKWSGCLNDDNVDYGYKKSRDFLDVRKRKKGTDIRTRVRIHNNEAGRLAIINHMQTTCKCHGLSASCNVKTCWRQMPKLRRVGEKLKDRFDGSSKVIISNDGKHLLPEVPTHKDPDQEDIVYTEESPDFCLADRKHGSLGTSGRLCNATSLGTGGCELLCCGRSYKTRYVSKIENCQCRFHYCCEVRCETCIVNRTEHRCL